MAPEGGARLGPYEIGRICEKANSISGFTSSVWTKAWTLRRQMAGWCSGSWHRSQILKRHLSGAGALRTGQQLGHIEFSAAQRGPIYAVIATHNQDFSAGKDSHRLAKTGMIH